MVTNQKGTILKIDGERLKVVIEIESNTGKPTRFQI
jgi:hypothetical protein